MLDLNRSTEIDPIVIVLHTNVLGSNFFLGGVEGFQKDQLLHLDAQLLLVAGCCGGKQLPTVFC